MLRYRFLLISTLLALALVANAAPGQPPAKDLHGDPLPPGAVARLGTTRCRHDYQIVFAGFHPDGKSVISVSVDGVVCASEFPSGKEIRRFKTLPVAEGKDESAALVTEASLSRDGKHLTAFCTDDFVRIWDWANARQLGKVANSVGGGGYGGGLGGGFGQLGALGGGQLGALGGGFGQVHGVSSFKHGYSPDGKALMLAASPRVLQLVDFPTGKQIGPSLGHTTSLTSVAFTADGGQVLTQDAKSTRSWNAVTGKDLGTITIKLPPALLVGLFNPPIISPDGRVGGAVGQSFNNAAGQVVQTWEAVLFDTASGKVLRRIVLEVGPQFLLPTMHFSPDSKMLALHAGAKKKIELYDIASGKLRRTLDAGPAAPPAQGGIFPGMMAPFQKMLYSADGKALAFQDGPGANIVVRDTTTGNEIASLTPVKDSLAMQRAFSPDGRCLAVEISDGTVTVYELASGQPRRIYGTKRPSVNNDPFAGFLGDPVFIDQSRVSVAIAPDGKLLALSGPGGAVHLWDILTGKEWAALKGHTSAVTAVAFAPNGKTLASASADTTALIWDVVKIARPALPVKALKPGDLETWWQTLADDDAAKAYAAMADFAAVPKDTVAWIKERVKPAAPPDMKRAEELMKQLDDGQYKVREKATSELLKIGELLVPVFDKVLAAKPSLETKRRLEELRSKMTCIVLQGERLRVVRAVEVLEIIGTPQARQVLQTLAEGVPGALVTTSAQAALKR